jgi:hypothetical protein
VAAKRRHAQLKGPQAVAPVVLRDPARIEALLCCHFLALLTEALIERQISAAMAKSKTKTIPLYPEDRDCTAPSARRVREPFAGSPDLTVEHLFEYSGDGLEVGHDGLLRKRALRIHEEESVSADDVSASLVSIARCLRDALAGFQTLAATEKACAATRARVAARAVEEGAHRAEGFADGADWLARHTGSSSGEARMALETATAVEACPQTERALFAGEVSLAQANEITRTQAEVPGAEADLLALAKRSGLSAVRDEARNRRLTAADPDELHRRQHRARQFRHWRDAAGMVCFSGALAPLVGTPLMHRLDADADRLRRDSRRHGRDEPRAAHAADALAAMLAGSGRGHPIRSDMVIVCDLNAHRRGHAHPGEPSHIIGGGPIPVAQVRALAEDAFLKVVLHDGVRIDTVAHFGRHINAHLRTALELGSPPDFDGAVCVELGCGRRYGLEWDHVNPVANQGLTSYDNLDQRCWPHHQEKTERDRQAGLLGPVPP